MTDKKKAKELASLLVGEDQNQEPLVEILKEMAQWKKQQMMEKVCEFLIHLNNNHEVMSYASSRSLETHELISYFNNFISR